MVQRTPKRTGTERATTKISDRGEDILKRLAKVKPGEDLLAALDAPSDSRARRRHMQRIAAVQAAYDNAPPGAEAIADAVWRKIQSFRPKLTGREMYDFSLRDFRRDVQDILCGNIWKVRSQEIKTAEAEDDARRAARVVAPGKANGRVQA